MTTQTSHTQGDPAVDGGGALEDFEDQLGYCFSDRRLLIRALTHRSYANEKNDSIGDNQRLEFLGDAVLGLIVADELFDRDRHVQEGTLSSRQAQIVCEPTLAGVARRLQLGQYLRLGRGESSSGGRDKSSLLADAFEALLAAIYLDGSFDEARTFVISQLGDTLTDVRETSAPTDYKSWLQTVIQRDRAIQPTYRIVDASGPAHQRVFVAQVCVDGQPLGEGRGRSKQVAEQQAAQQALDTLNADPQSDEGDQS